MDDPIDVLRTELPIRTPADAMVVAACLSRHNRPGALVAVFLDGDERIVDLLTVADTGDRVAHVVDLLCQLPLAGVRALLLVSDRTGDVPADRPDDELTWLELVDRTAAVGIVLRDWFIVSGRYAFSAAEHAPLGAQWDGPLVALGSAPMDDPLLRAYELLVRRGPTAPEELAELLVDEELEVDDPELLADYLSEGEHPVWTLRDERLVAADWMQDGTIATHRLTDAEAKAGVLLVEPDLELLCLGEGWGIDLAGGGRLAHITSLKDRPDLGGANVTGLEGPAGWLDGYEAGTLLGLRCRDGAVEIEPIAAPIESDEDLLAAIRAAFGLVTYEGAADVVEIVVELAAVAREHLRRPQLPFGELLAAAGLKVRGETVTEIDTPWEEVERRRDEARIARYREDHGLSRRDAEALGEVVRAFFASRYGDEEPDAAAVERAAAGLARPDVAAAFLHAIGGPILQVEGIERFGGLVAAAARDRSPGAAWLLGLAAEWRGDAVEADRRIRQALELDPEFHPALEPAVWWASQRGDAARALALLRRLGAPEDDDHVRGLASLAGAGPSVGRNEPCPCGSGRKYKQCCLGAGGIPLIARAVWLWQRLRAFVCRGAQTEATMQHHLLAAGLEHPDDDAEAFVQVAFDDLVADALVSEGRFLDRYLEVVGPLLRDDERALAESWVGARLQLLESGEPGYLRADDGAAVETVDERPPGQHVLGVPVQVEGRWVSLSGTYAVPAEEADEVRDALASGRLDAILPVIGRLALTGAGDARERVGWLFPATADEWYDGIPLDELDPTDSDDRAILVAAEHPDLDEAIEAGLDEIDGVDPRLHLTLHEIVAEQIVELRPPMVWATAQRLTALGHDRHEVLHMLAYVAGEHGRRNLVDSGSTTTADYEADLDALPGSWERLGHRSRSRRYDRPR